MLLKVKPLFHLAWPILITQLIQTLLVTIDLLMSARVSEADMAAVGTALGVWHPAYFFSIGVIMVMSPILARAYGESNLKKLAHQFNNGLWLSVIVCLIALFALSFSDSIFELLKLDNALQVIGSEYLFYLMFGLPFICITACFRFFNEAVGQTKPLMVLSGLSLIINIPLNAIFIYGWFGVPALGGAGCGIATTIVNLLILIGFIWSSFRFSKTRHALHYFKLHKPNIKELIYQFKIGLPIGFTIFMELALFGAVALAIATHGTEAAAAHQIALNVTTNFYMVPLSLGFAITALIGQAVGRQDLADAKKVAQAGIVMSLLFALCSCVVIIIFRDLFISWFTTEIAVVSIAMALLIWAGAFQLPDVIQTIINASLRGYADTQKPMIIVLISYWLIGFPLGVILAETHWIIPAMGVTAYWLGLLISLSCSAVFLSIRLAYFWRKSSQAT